MVCFLRLAKMGGARSLFGKRRSRIPLAPIRNAALPSPGPLPRTMKRALRELLEEPVSVFRILVSDHSSGGTRFPRRQTATGYGVGFFLGAGAGVLAFPVVPVFPPALLSK